MKKKEVKKFVLKCEKRTKRKVYIIIGVLTAALITSVLVGHIRYEKLKADTWDKIEEVLDMKHQSF